MSVDRGKIHNAIKAITVLRPATESIPRYLVNLVKCIDKSAEIMQDPDYNLLIGAYESPTRKFCYAALYLLNKLADAFTGDAVEDLLSTSQQLSIRILLQMLFCLGVLPCLKQSVNVNLVLLTKELNLYKGDLDNWTLDEKNDFLSHAVLGLIYHLKVPNLRALILANLGGLLSAILQLIHCPVKQDDQKGFTDEKRKEILDAFDELSESIYKPLLIKELLILLSPKRGKANAFPRWLERAIIQILTGYLTKCGGVAMTIRACCPSNTDDVKWPYVVSLAKLISTVHDNIDPDTFYSLISPQVIALLHATGPYCLPVAKMCIRSIFEKDLPRCDKYFFGKLFEPFVLCSKPLSEKFNGTFISEAVISRCIDNLNKCFDQDCVDSKLPMNLLTPIIKIQFLLYTKILGSKYQHTNAVEQLLVRYLTDIEKDFYPKIFSAFLYDESHDEILNMNDQLQFEFDSSGGIQVSKKAEEVQKEMLLFDPKMERAFQSLLALNKSCTGKGDIILLRLFLYALQAFSDNSEPTYLPDFEMEFKKKGQQLFTIKMLIELSEHESTTDLIKRHVDGFYRTINELLARYLTLETKNIDTMCLMLPLRLLDIITCQLKPGDPKWKTMGVTGNYLKTIRKVCPEDCKDMCNLLFQKIITEGALDKCTAAGVAPSSNDELTNILAMISSSLPAMKGCGLILLKKHFKTLKDEIVARKSEIIEMLKACLTDSESYVYLAAINAFEALYIVYDEQVIHTLCEEFGNKDGSLEEQMKLGEVLMRVVRNLDQASALGPLVISTFLLGVKSKEEYLRASSLVNLGEAFKCFKYLGASYTGMVTTCLQSILSTDKSVLVRRAAAHAGSLIIQAHISSQLTLADKITLLGDLYRTLRNVKETDKDETVRIHADAALMEFNQQMEENLTQELPLTKKISVLDF